MHGAKSELAMEDRKSCGCRGGVLPFLLRWVLRWTFRQGLLQGEPGCYSVPVDRVRSPGNVPLFSRLSSMAGCEDFQPIHDNRERYSRECALTVAVGAGRLPCQRLELEMV